MKINNKKHALHLTYCSNIHSGETWPDIFANLQNFVPRLRDQLAIKSSFGIGLRLSNCAATQLLKKAELLSFKKWLEHHNFYVFTLNGFPYGEFHGQRVKEQVYAPDWLTKERLEYCLKLLRVLTELTPPGCESGFSTSPISYKLWLNKFQQAVAFETACISLSKIAVEMIKVYHETGKLIHIDIEPEPDCLLETVDEIIYFFQHWLLPIGKKYLVSTLKISDEKAEDYLKNHIRVCYDICHSAVEFEKPEAVFKRLSEAGIRIGKIQISSALKIMLNKKSKKTKILNYLKQFADSTYLHQVVGQTSTGSFLHYRDLPELIYAFESINIEELRVHFHVPIFLKNFELLQSTQSEIKETLQLLSQNETTKHLEIETYTWEVLPTKLKLDITSSLQREYEWILQQLEN